MQCPKGLEYHGKKLWKSITDEFEIEYDPHKQRILLDACKLADQIDVMEKAAAKAPMTVPGSRPGTVVIHPLISELRFTRALLTQTLCRLNFEGTLDVE